MWNNWDINLLLLGMENDAASLENSLAVNYKLCVLCNHKFHSREMKIYVHIKPCVWIFTAALDIITRYKYNWIYQLDIILQLVNIF